MYIYKLHMCMWAQARDVYSVWRVVFEWEDLKVTWAMQFSPLALLRPALHTLLPQNCNMQQDRAMQKGVQPAPI